MIVGDLISCGPNFDGFCLKYVGCKVEKMSGTWNEREDQYVPDFEMVCLL